jgi:ankyrin repeat protein
MVAAEGKNREEIFKTLLKAGGSIDAERTAKNKTALMFFAESDGKEEFVKLIIEVGAVIEAKDNEGRTALMFAIKNNRIKNFEALLKAGADIEAKNNSGRTGLMIAIENNRIEIINIFLIGAKRANIEARDNRGRTPLMIAIENNKIEIVKILIELGADINAKDNKGQTAMELALAAGFKEITQLLTSEPNSPNKKLTLKEKFSAAQNLFKKSPPRVLDQSKNNPEEENSQPKTNNEGAWEIKPDGEYEIFVNRQKSNKALKKIIGTEAGKTVKMELSLVSPSKNNLSNPNSKPISSVVEERQSVYRKLYKVGNLSKELLKEKDVNALVKIICVAAKKRGLSIEKAIEVIEIARQKGGVFNSYKKDDKNRESYVEAGATKDGDERKRRNFSGDFQTLCQGYGIYSARSGDEDQEINQPLVGLRTAFIPQEVVEKLKLLIKEDKNYKATKDDEEWVNNEIADATAKREEYMNKKDNVDVEAKDKPNITEVPKKKVMQPLKGRPLLSNPSLIEALNNRQQ